MSPFIVCIVLSLVMHFIIRERRCPRCKCLSARYIWSDEERVIRGCVACGHKFTVYR